MAFILGTNVAIHLRDGDAAVIDRTAALEGGVYREPAYAHIRRSRLDAILASIPTLAFDDAAARTYGAIVASAGYSRRKLLDRMIAAQALVHRATLVTLNPDDFSDIPGLALLGWR